MLGVAATYALRPAPPIDGTAFGRASRADHGRHRIVCANACPNCTTVAISSRVI